MYDSLKICWNLLRSDKRGVTAVEYAVIAGIMVAAVGVAFTSLGSTLKAYMATISFG